MPEQITKYPDVTLKVLAEAGALCGKGAEQKILTTCPRDRFCALSTGEICVYGIDEIPRMTQISAQELARAVSGPSSISTAEIAAFGALFALGLLCGRVWGRYRKR